MDETDGTDGTDGMDDVVPINGLHNQRLYGTSFQRGTADVSGIEESSYLNISNIP